MITREDIIKAMNESDCEWFGLRYDYHDYKIGDKCENSHQWWQDAENLTYYQTMTQEEIDSLYDEQMDCYDDGELEGTCCLEITENTIDKILEEIKMYKYDDKCKCILIGGDGCQGGNDPGEVIIRNAIVLA